MERAVSLLGLLVLVLLAWLLSSDKRRMNVRLIVSGIVLQFLLALLILRTAPGRLIFEYCRIFITQVVGFSDAGAEFLYKNKLYKRRPFISAVFRNYLYKIIRQVNAVFSLDFVVLYAGRSDYIFLLKYSVMSFRWPSLRFGTLGWSIIGAFSSR